MASVSDSITKWVIRDGKAAQPSVFVYGSLMCDGVLTALLGRVPEKACCKLVDNDYIRLQVKGECFPALSRKSFFPDANFQDTPDQTVPYSCVAGVLLLNLTEQEFTMLDYFEDEFYHLTEVDVVLGSDIGEVVERSVAWTIGEEESKKYLSLETWEYERDFINKGEDNLKEYIAMSNEVREEYYDRFPVCV